VPVEPPVAASLAGSDEHAATASKKSAKPANKCFIDKGTSERSPDT
jgi:hypothetical protein